MPLKLVPPREGKSPHYTIRGTYLRVSVNQSSGVSKRALAQKELQKIERDIESGRWDDNGPTFATAALKYMKGGGEKTYLTKLLRYFGDKPISTLDQSEIDRAATDLYPKGTAATRNRSVYTPVCAVIRNAGQRLNLRRPKGSGGSKTTAWLWPEQATALIQEAYRLDKTFAALLIVLLYTGMRLSEALGLTWNDVRMEEGFAYVSDTKNCEPRAVFLPKVAVDALHDRYSRRTRRSRRVFGFVKGGHIYHLLRAASAKAGIELPPRSAFHIFRHTYATWMRRYGGLDTRGLVGTGAWKDAKSAQRYAHALTTEEAGKAQNLPIVWSGNLVESGTPQKGNIDKTDA